jgi:hypothetical protein
MSMQPLGNPRVRYLDSNANPLSGGLLYTYVAGTTTPQATYTTRAGDFANTNPVVLDANGEADVWMLPGVLYSFVLLDSSSALQWSIDNFPSPVESSASTDVAATEPGGRLTLTSGTPVTTSDVTGATTVYYVPYKHDKVPLYDGTTWALYSIGSSGLSQATTDTTKSPTAVTTNSNYDLFVWNDSGTVRLSRGPAWTSATARGAGVGTTELQQVNGRYVNKNAITNGPGAQKGLYVGSIRTDGSSQVNDASAFRHLWNAHHRVRRELQLKVAGSWNYSTGSWRQANGSAANQLDFLCGLSEDAVSARLLTSVHNSTATSRNVAVAIGLDSTTAGSSDCIFQGVQATQDGLNIGASYTGNPGLGRHVLTWLELGFGSDTQTWGSGSFSSGLNGEMLG